MERTTDLEWISHNLIDPSLLTYATALSDSTNSEVAEGDTLSPNECRIDCCERLCSWNPRWALFIIAMVSSFEIDMLPLTESQRVDFKD